MKSLIKAVAIAAVLAAPVASFAQSSDQPITRAEVRQQLIQVEQAGYNPATANDPQYPADVQAAEQRVQAQNPPVAQVQEPVADTSGYGGAVSGSSQSGVARPLAQQQSVYFGH
jgi:opacity protein-like surface antigen